MVQRWNNCVKKALALGLPTCLWFLALRSKMGALSQTSSGLLDKNNGVTLEEGMVPIPERQNFPGNSYMFRSC